MAAGFATTLASGWLLVLAAMRLLSRPKGSSTEYQMVAEPAAYFLLLVGEADVLSALLAACLLGGVVAGTLSPSAPGANGATAAAFGALVGVAWLLLAVPPLAALPTEASFVNPAARSVEVGTLFFCALALSAFHLLAPRAGCVGRQARKPPTATPA